MARVIATITNDDLGLIEETEVIDVSDDLKDILVEIGYAKFYDDSKPLPPKGLNEYEEGMIYPEDRYIMKDDGLYKSNQVTSTSWVPAEWTIKITGVNCDTIHDNNGHGGHGGHHHHH